MKNVIVLTNSRHKTEIGTRLKPGDRAHNDKVQRLLMRLCNDRRCPCYRVADGRYQFAGQRLVDTSVFSEREKPAAIAINRNRAWIAMHK